MSQPTLDPITTEVIGSLLMSVSEEMGATLIKTAYSPNIKERADCSTCVFDGRGQVIAQAQRIPIHLGSMLGTVEEIIRLHPVETIQPGDMFLANDPYTGGGTHLPDLNLVAPVFDGDEIIAYVANIAHHSDVGGMVAGSEAADCRDIFQEGLRIPPVRIYRAGELVEDILNLILLNTRTPRDRLGDIRAQFASNRVGVRGIADICAKYGRSTLLAHMDALLDYAERRARAGFAKIPDGVYPAEDWLDSDGIGSDPVRVSATVTVGGDRLHLDFTGTGPQLPTGRNVPTKALLATAYCVLKSLIDPGLPSNGGFYRAVELTAPEGSLVNPRPPAAVGVRSLTCAVLGDVIVAALANAMPERALAGSGPHHQILPSGTDPRTGEFFVDYETFAGSYGARPYKDGFDAVRIHASGASNLPVECLEHTFPLRIERYELRPDSGGAGRFRGGLSVRRDYRILANDATVALSAERQRVAARGIQGGQPGIVGRYVLNPDQPTEQVLSSTVAAFPLANGDVLSIQTPGGGGCGAAFERDPQLVLRDVREERVSPEVATKVYGVAIVGEEVDEYATKRLRGQ
ncbi:MAG: hydantoinase B/oxoprolinase family protein [Chloroflexi bacterium]|nr:hydantoinase B/oxoprolinase family protein [Chloroflexota bacterium]